MTLMMNVPAENQPNQLNPALAGKKVEATVDEKPFRLAKSFSLIAVVMIFAAVLTLAAVVSRQAEIIITKRVEDDTLKLMANLNHQMYENFLKKVHDPTGRSQLRNTEQQELLHEVIKNTIYGFDLKRVLLYDSADGRVVYDTDKILFNTPVRGKTLKAYQEALSLYVPPRSDFQIEKPWYAQKQPQISPRWSIEGGLNMTPAVDINPSVGRPPGSPPDKSEDLDFSWLSDSNYSAIPDNEDRERYIEDAYFESLRAQTVFTYEGGSYLFLNFLPRGNFVLRSFKVTNSPEVTLDKIYACFADWDLSCMLLGATGVLEHDMKLGMTGVLEVDRDLTPEYRQIARLQYFALSVAIILALGLTIILFWVVNRGEAIITKRNLERQALREQLDQAERLAGLGSMVATVAHEIRNPLGIIHSTADVLDRFLADEPDRARLAKAIVEEANRLSEVVTEFLDFARPPVPRLQPVVIEEILEEILAFLEVTLTRAGVEVRTDFRKDQSPTPGDAPMLHRAFLNILVNAIQAMDDGGLIRVSTALKTHETGARRLAVVISDTGPGLSEDSAKKMFSPFYTTKAKGTGLGLVIVRNIIEGHGGEISLKNGPSPEPGDDCGPGLVVTISLKA